MAILQEVKQLGQQIWLDNLSRSLVRSGTLAKWQQSGVSGVTSNPAIFRQALAGDALYTAEIAQLKQQPLSAKARYETLAVADVQAACDVFAAQFAAEGNSGLVSLECDPALSHDTDGTIAEARRLWRLIGRPNAMIKIPATDAGLAALPALVADGININLTLLFSRAQTVRAYQAYQQGLAQRAGQAAPQLVASFFISRIDTALDPQLPPQLQGKTALALAQAAYQDWQQFFSQPSSAVPTARLLWASTGVKNPAYPDTLYVDNLIAPHTVNTLPDAVLQAFTDHGRAADALSHPAVPAQPILDEVTALGIDLEALAAKLQQDGLAQFEQAFAQMLAPLAD
ncbi:MULTISPECIES: transaldolase [unclassified Eikenella]|uniref:transaldolase n=1 Tax=unclassified Eikenella TaxID=2639367 RepID=UPI0008A57343|nr:MULTISPECIES: transaldolase [unclassified Eikenella]OFK86935.1 transaldolase [Eikenella sp. HMSC071B05]OFO44683.1 transaldolase [Eikenella sp. HMSC073A11]